MTAITIDEITLADEPATWAGFGFEIEDERCLVGTSAVRLAGAAARRPGHGGGLACWSLRGLESLDLDGLPTEHGFTAAREAAPAHPNGVVAIDHLVAVSPDLDRTVASLQSAGLDLRRVREEPTPAGAPRQAFFRLGEVILETVQEPAHVVEAAGGRDRPAHFWGLALLSEDIERTAAAFGEHCGGVRDAVQEGRRIATVKRSAGLCVPLALMSVRAEGVLR
jgi:hypothetical protein